MSAGRCYQSGVKPFISLLAVLMPLLLVLAVPLPSFAQTRLSSPLGKLPAPGSYPGAVSLDPAMLEGNYLFRFSPLSPWRPFDRVLILDAFPGEHRRYELELRSGLSGELLEFEYSIDRMPPEAPDFFPVPGDAGPSLSIEPKGEGRLMLSTNGGPFVPYDANAPESFQAPTDGSSIVTALAYALDEHGNASWPASAVWRLSNLKADSLPSFKVSQTKQAELRRQEKVEGLSIRVSTESGANPVVIVDVPAGSTPIIAVQSSRDEPSRASFIRIPPSAGRARAEIPVPWGYDLELSVQYGYEDGEVMVLAGKPSMVRADFPSRGPTAPPAKAPEPVLSSTFGATLLSWPPSMTDLYFSIDGAAYIRYQAPVLLPYRGPIPYGISYQSANDGGRSPPVSVSVEVSPRLEAPVAKGIEAGQTFGLAPSIQVDAPHGSVRFEMTVDGSEPVPPRDTSPAFKDSPPFAGVDGKLVRYRLRLASVDDKGNVGPERYLDFSVDREAPPAPILSQSLPAYSANDLLLALKPSESGALVYLSVADDGPARFQEYRGPIVLAGSDDGRKRYVIRAYTEDVFGNRSPEMEPVTVLVDRSSLYVDPVGRSNASGTPDDPLPSLQAALMASAVSGRRVIHLRGNHVLDGSIQIDGSLRLLGGYTADWTTSQQETVSIRFSRPLATGTAGLRIRGGLLELRSLGILSEGSGISVLIDAKDASLVLSQVSLAMSGGLEATAIKLDSSRLDMNDVAISISAVVTGRALDTVESGNIVDKLAITADSSVRLFDALRMVGGRSSLRDLRIDASPGLAFSGLSLSKAQVSMSTSAFIVKGGGSSLRLFNLNAASLTADSLFGDINWLGEAELFRLGSSSSLYLSHATVLSKAKRLSVVDSRDSLWSIVNSIFNADSPSALFAVGSLSPKAGSVSANCLWGFSSFLSGGGKSGSLAELNRYASLEHPNFIEAPSRTFASINKGFPILSAQSACIGTAAPLPWVLPEELKVEMRRLPASRDIGVDGLREGRL